MNVSQSLVSYAFRAAGLSANRGHQSVARSIYRTIAARSTPIQAMRARMVSLSHALEGAAAAYPDTDKILAQCDDALGVVDCAWHAAVSDAANASSEEDRARSEASACLRGSSPEASPLDCPIAHTTYEALRCAFHPALQQSSHPAPVLTDPRRMRRLLSEHAITRALMRRPAGAPARRTAGGADTLGRADGAETLTPVIGAGNETNAASPDSADTAAPGTARPTRVLILTDSSLSFLRDAIRTWGSEASYGVDVKARNLADEGVDPSLWNLNRVTHEALYYALNGTPLPIPEAIAADCEWADVVVVEWCTGLAAALSRMDLPCRLVVRLHRYEAFTLMPALVCWENVDCLITVSPWVAQCLATVIPACEQLTDMRLSPNATDLEVYRHGSTPSVPGASRASTPPPSTSSLPPAAQAGSRRRRGDDSGSAPVKSPQARWTLGLIGYGSYVKDPLWALDVLARLREVQPRWRLELIGNPPPRVDSAPPGQRDYWQAYYETRYALGEAVVERGYRGDIPQVLEDIGVILSSSRLESAHLALQQGAISGCLPVVRDWPDVQAFGGATDLYPQEWIVETSEQAAQRIAAWNGRPCVHSATHMAQLADYPRHLCELTEAITGHALPDGAPSGTSPRPAAARRAARASTSPSPHSHTSRGAS